MRNHLMNAARSMKRARSGLAALAAVAGLAAGGCFGSAGPTDERPVPSAPLVLTTDTGERFSGPPARLDVRVDAAGQVTAELAVDVADAAGQHRAVLTALPASALATGAGAPGALRAADARVQLVRLAGGQIEGTLDGA